MVSTSKKAVWIAVSAGLATSLSAMAQVPADVVADPVLRQVLSRLTPPPGGGGTDAPIGPDVIVGEIQNSGGCCPNSETTTISPVATVGSIVAYGLGTSSCNIGDANLLWVSGTPYHPIIPQNMYRLESVNGATRFEQIGQSWSKYAFTALQYYVCAANPLGGQTSCNGSGGSVLGIGCSDPYTAGRNATQSSAGPRYQCNPFTGSFPDSTAVRNAWPATVNSTSRRMQVNTSDISSTLHPGALFFGECMYVNRDDACFGNSRNNASYRRVNLGTGNALLLQGAIGGVGTHRKSPAIFAWQNNGLGVDTADPSVIITEVTCGNSFFQQPPFPYNSGSGTGSGLVSPAGDGWVYLGSKATDLGGGVWHYEYAIENLNSDRGVGSFAVHFAPGTIITNAEIKQINAHSGIVAEDASRNAAWTQTISPNGIRWASPNSFDTATPTLGSYIRWGTMYNFRFDANVGPVQGGTATVGYYKSLPGYADTIEAAAQVPANGPPCYANCDLSAVAPVLNANDFQCFINSFAVGADYANCDGSSTPPVLQVNDFQCFINAFAVGCN